MILAVFYRGVFDGRRLVLPIEEPWPKFVIPQWDTLTIEQLYLLAGQLDEAAFAYLYEDDWGELLTT